jgi:5-oxoprolinase (ATP-hydrolysing)
MALADVAVDNSEPFLLEYGPEARSAIEARFQALEAEGRGQLVAQGIAKSRIKYERYLNLKNRGSDTKIMILQPETNDFAKAFEEQHKREFAFNLDSAIDIENIRVRAVGFAAEQDDTSASPFVQDLETLPSIPVDQTASFGTQAMFFEEVGKFTGAPLFRLEDLGPGTVVQGPGILLDKTQTIVLHPQNVARILNNCVYIDVGLGPRAVIDATVVDPIQLSIFSHRFMGIAEQMGRALQKTAMSVQIKERLDFSCAIFGPDAALVANAPNVPVHLGSMQYAVEYQAALHKGQLRHGDILVSNRPIAGGTHLPDLTVIQPVFDEDDPAEIVFWVAGRGHHGDIGGLDGNSMPPNSTEAWQEGVAISSMILVRDGQLNEEGLRKAFEQAGSFPGCLPPRQPHVNISDLKAKCSACAIGSSQIHALFKE